MITYEGVMEAYLDCRRKKRRTANALKCEAAMEDVIAELVDAVNNRSYTPSRSIAFIVTYPRYREVFAADFKDRIMHHYVALRLEPLFENVLNDRTFNCRKGKGTLCGIQQLKEDIYSCSEGYTKDCYIAKFDIKGFFMSISKPLIHEMVDAFISKHYTGEDKEDLRFICKQINLHHTENNCIKQSRQEMWKHIPPNKSLFTNEPSRGVPIGNLPSQIFANFVLDKFDWEIEKQGFKYHGRYVDDSYVIHTNKDKLLELAAHLRAYLRDELQLELHPNKFYLQHYTKGVEFIGAFVKPYRSYILNRSVFKLKQQIRRMNKSRNLAEIKRNIHSINSYLGLMGHHSSYGIRRRLLKEISPRVHKYLYITNHHKKVALKKKYKDAEIYKERIRNGEFYKFTLAEPIH